jgi:hypothetical protein
MGGLVFLQLRGTQAILTRVGFVQFNDGRERSRENLMHWNREMGI